MLQLLASACDWHLLFSTFAIATLSSIIATLGFLYFTYGPTIPSKSPPEFSKYSFPIIGALKFFTRRQDFFLEAQKASPSGHFSFAVGKYHVIGVNGLAARRDFFETKSLSFQDGYSALLNLSGGQAEGDDSTFAKHFNTRLVQILRNEILSNGIKLLLQDTKDGMVELANFDVKLTDPFESIYRVVFQLTMRTVGCNEIATDATRREKALRLYQQIEGSSTPTTVIFPWLPSPAMIQRTIAGARLYSMFNGFIDDRKKTGRREHDPLQHMMDMGDDTMKVLTVTIGSLFAGFVNAGVNAASLLVYLAAYPEWQEKVRQELHDMRARHVEDKTAPVLDQLCSLDLDVWETSFPTLELCLKESIRIQTLGVAMRRNSTTNDVKLGDAVIPPGAVATYLVNNVHFDPGIYPEPDKWDPARYLRGEEKKLPYSYLAWGAGRHPCLGMKFAKLEMNIIIAFFLAAFEYTLSDENGGPGFVPIVDRRTWISATRPQPRPFLKYKVREGAF